MRVFLILILTILSALAEKKHTNYLTESMGQEVIEIGAPIKDLPPDLEEEPSAENDDDKGTTTTVAVATKKDFTNQNIERDNSVKKVKGVNKIDGQKDDEEARIEKELSDLYKDSVDYKADSEEVTKEVTDSNATDNTELPILRARSNFKFQPDSNHPEDVARFRTSVDEISCRKSKLSAVTTLPASGCEKLLFNIGIWPFLVQCIFKMVSYLKN